MVTVRIEHPVKSFPEWKAAFDRDPADRRGSGVRRYSVLQPVEDPEYVMIDLAFDSTVQADLFLERMRRVWATPAAALALGGPPRATVVHTIETMTL